jgi:hypothetical protein
MADPGRFRRISTLLALLGIAAVMPPIRTGRSEDPSQVIPRKTQIEQRDDEFPVPFEPLPKTITPCRACHGPEKDFEVNWTREEVLRVHTDIRLDHGGIRVWCLDCHSPTERDYLLPLSDGKPIVFERSYELCGKCHGTKYRDWRQGIHGKRTGYWNGTKTYHLCTQCHNPHSPRFKPLEPLPPPRTPRTPKSSAAKH